MKWMPTRSTHNRISAIDPKKNRDRLEWPSLRSLLFVIASEAWQSHDVMHCRLEIAASLRSSQRRDVLRDCRVTAFLAMTGLLGKVKSSPNRQVRQKTSLPHPSMNAPADYDDYPRIPFPQKIPSINPSAYDSASPAFQH